MFVFEINSSFGNVQILLDQKKGCLMYKDENKRIYKEILEIKHLRIGETATFILKDQKEIISFAIYGFTVDKTVFAGGRKILSFYSKNKKQYFISMIFDALYLNTNGYLDLKEIIEVRNLKNDATECTFILNNNLKGEIFSTQINNLEFFYLEDLCR